MSLKKILSIFLVVFGEGLIIFAFLHFGVYASHDVLVLNIVISSLIFFLYASRLIAPRFNLKDKSQSAIGGIGIKGYFFLIYSVAAIWVMINFNIVIQEDPYTQLIVHLVLLFLLCLGIYFSVSASAKVTEVYDQQQTDRMTLDSLKKSAKAMQLTLAKAKLSDEIMASFSELSNDLRYISPSRDEEAVMLEQNIKTELEKLHDYLLQQPVDTAKIILAIQNCKLIYHQRQQVYTR